MSRSAYREPDLMYQILPAVKTRRVTIESSADNNIILTMDMYIDDHLTPEGVGMLMNLPNSFDKDAQMPKEDEFMKALKIGIIVSHKGKDRAITRRFQALAARRTLQDVGVEFGTHEGGWEQTQAMMTRIREQYGFSENEAFTGMASSMDAFLRMVPVVDEESQWITRREPARQSKPGQFFEDYSDHFRVTNASNQQPEFYRIPYTITIGNDPERPQELIPGNTKDLSVHAFTYFDFSDLNLDFDLKDIRYLNVLHGKRLKQTILRKGRVDSYNMVLRDNKGTPYNGPYHMMPAQTGEPIRFMKGFRHSDSLGINDYLTAINVPNTKVQDFRKMKRTTADLYTPLMLPSLHGVSQMPKFLKNKRDKNFNAQLDIHQDPESGEVGFTFIIDQKQVLEKGSRLGHLFKHLPNLTKYEMLRPKVNFKLVNAKVVRRRVTDRNLGINSLGFPAKDLFDRNEPEFVVAEASQERSLHAVEQEMKEEGISAAGPNALTFSVINPVVPSFLLDERDNTRLETGEISDVFWVNIYSSLNANYSELADYLRGETGQPPIGADGLPLFPFYRIFEGKDLSLKSTVDGTYQYGIELEYEDSMFDFYERSLERFRVQLRQLKEYYNLARIPVVTGKSFRETRGNGPGRDELMNSDRLSFVPMGNYNAITKKFEPHFIEMARERFDFAAMELAFFDLLGLIRANKQFTVKEGTQTAAFASMGLTKAANDEDPERWEELVMPLFERTFIQDLLQPYNNRPQQIAEVLKSFQDLETEVSKILGAPSEGDQSSNSSEFGGKRNFTSGKNRTIKIKRYFTGEGDSEVGSYYVDCTMRRVDTVDMGLAQSRYEAEAQRQQSVRDTAARLQAEIEARRAEERARQDEQERQTDNFVEDVSQGAPGLGSDPNFAAAVEDRPSPPQRPRRRSRRSAARRRRADRAAAASQKAQTKGRNGFPWLTPGDIAERMVKEKQKWGDALDNYMSDAAVFTFEGYKGNPKQKNSWFKWGSKKDTTEKSGVKGGNGIWGSLLEKKEALEVVNMSRQSTQENPWWNSFNWGDKEEGSIYAGKGGKGNPHEQPKTKLAGLKARIADSMTSITNLSVTVPSGPAFEKAVTPVDEKELCGIGNEPDEPEGFPFNFKETLRQAGGAHHSFLDLSKVLTKDIGKVINPDVLKSTLPLGTNNGLGGLGGAISFSKKKMPAPISTKKYPAVNSAVLDAAAVLERMDGFARDADGNINLGKPLYSAVNQVDLAAGKVLPGKYRLRYAQDPSTEAGNQTKANTRPWLGGGSGGKAAATRPAQKQAFFDIKLPTPPEPEPTPEELAEEAEEAAETAQHLVAFQAAQSRRRTQEQSAARTLPGIPRTPRFRAPPGPNTGNQGGGLGGGGMGPLGGGY